MIKLMYEINGTMEYSLYPRSLFSINDAIRDLRRTMKELKIQIGPITHEVL
jgi:hypothetical protein